MKFYKKIIKKYKNVLRLLYSFILAIKIEKIGLKVYFFKIEIIDDFFYIYRRL